MSVDGRDDSGETYVHDEELGENINVEYMLYCAECDCDHADFRIYEYLHIDLPDCEKVEVADDQEPETIQTGESETTPSPSPEATIQAQVSELAREFMLSVEYLQIDDTTERINLLIDKMSEIQTQLLNNQQRNNDAESAQTTIPAGSDYEVAGANPQAA